MATQTNEYRQLAQRFGVVRRAWKRAAALSGLAIVLTEGVGILTALLFADWLYQPLPWLRFGLWAAALACIGYLFVRHVLKPLGRKIPDEQVALYMEENLTELDGVLITAVEYGRDRDKRTGNQGVLIDAVVREAAARSGRTQIGRLVDFSRFRKYGIGAAISIGLYVLLSALFPSTFGYRLGRILQPWHVTGEDVARHDAAVQMAAPLRFTLSKGSTSLQRGTSFAFEVTLSKTKPAQTPVLLYFRPRIGGAQWQHLPMTEIEKLNGFQGAIPDVNEDLEFYVGCGPDKSDTYRLTVFDPLVVQSMEMRVRYPAYIHQPDDVQRPFAGDLTALTGSTATLRILTSTPLKEGEIKWSDGHVEKLTVDPGAKATATVSFEVKGDATYDYNLTDVNGQSTASAAPLSVHALPDNPPTVQIKSPQSPVLTHPLGEINFQVEGGDDFGVAGIDLVYALLDEKGETHEIRAPLKLEAGDAKDPLHPVEASYRLMLEDVNPPFRPDDAISYYVEARDAKGQKTRSEIGFILVGYFEHWATWGTEEGTGVHDHRAPDLMALLNLTWQVDSKKARLSAADFQTQSRDIAGKLAGPDGVVFDFVNPTKYPQLARVAGAVNAHVKKAHDDLMAADTQGALPELSAAVALTAGGKLKEDNVIHTPSQQIMLGNPFSPPGFTLLEQARLNALAAAAKDKTHAEGNEAEAKIAAEMARKVEELRKGEEAIIGQAQKQPAAGSPAADDKSKMPKGDGAGAAAGKQDKPDLAGTQHALADKTRAAAAGAGAAASGADPNSKLAQGVKETGEAARLMEEAARAFGAGNNSEGQIKANLAKTTLQEAGEKLNTSDRDKFEAAISEAARHAAMLLEKQQDLSAQTTALATDLGDNKPDQRQHRDLQAQAYQQTVLGANADALGAEINDLNQLAAQVGQPQAIRELTEAQRVFKRTPPQAKMADAVIDLNNASPATAAPEQKDAETALAKIVASLQAGSESLAGNREAELNRASRAASEAKNAFAAVLAKGGAQAKGEPAQGGAEGKGDQAKGGAQGKSDPAQASAPGKGDPSAGTQGSATQPSPDGQGNASGGGDDVRTLAYDLNQLAAVLDNGQLVPADDAERLKEMTMDKAELEKRLAVDPKLLRNGSDLVARISDKIEAERAAKAEAGKLFSSQREECPPSYRQFVNKYFEALSQVSPTRAPAANNPAPAGQF